MSTIKYLLAAAVVLCRLSQTSACYCPVPPGTHCDTFLETDVILHVKALDRARPDTNPGRVVVYTLETIEVFKGEELGPNEYEEVGGNFAITTGGNLALCGVYMDTTTNGTEYLIGINRRDGNLYAAGLCGLFGVWNEDDRETLEEGCDSYDPCDGGCGEFEECTRRYDFSVGNFYNCTGTCDPSPCEEGEVCTLVNAEATCSEAETPSPSLPPAVTPPPGLFDSALTLPPGASVDSSTSYTQSPTTGSN